MYKTPISTIFISPLPGPSQVEVGPVCTIGTECVAHHPLGMCAKTDLHQTPTRRLRSSAGNVSGRACRAVAVSGLLGIWKSLATGLSFQILSRQNLWPQRMRSPYFSRLVEATHPPKSCLDCCLVTCRDHGGHCNAHKCAFKEVVAPTQCIYSMSVHLLPVPGQWRRTKKEIRRDEGGNLLQISSVLISIVPVICPSLLSCLGRRPQKLGCSRLPTREPP